MEDIKQRVRELIQELVGLQLIKIVCPSDIQTSLRINEIELLLEIYGAIIDHEKA